MTDAYVKKVAEAVKVAVVDSLHPDNVDLDAIIASVSKQTVEQQRDELLLALETMLERFAPCRNQYVFSKRMAIDKAVRTLNSVKKELK